MRIHLLSDTHIEHFHDYQDSIKMPNVSGGVCVLAGDIGSAQKSTQYKKYLKEMRNQFDHVLLVLGNHEFYCMDYFDTLKKLKKVADATGVVLMDVEFGTENITIDGITFFGSTLWTDFKENDPYVKYRVGRSLNDFHIVERFTTDKALEMNMKTIARLNWNADVVITHHMPILREHSRFPIDEVSYGFCCTNLEEKIMQSKIKYWFYGHTHDNVSYMIGETTVMSNQMGYFMERMTKEYDPDFFVEI